MKKVKYYYSNVVHVRLFPVFTDAEGQPVFMSDSKPIKSKALPRITVSAVLDTETDTINFGVAVCSPKDLFKKSIGRELSYKRAVESPECTVKIVKKNRVREISKRYATQLINQYLGKYVQPNF